MTKWIYALCIVLILCALSLLSGLDQKLCLLFEPGSLDTLRFLSGKLTHVADALWYFLIALGLLLAWGAHFLLIKKGYFHQSYLKFKSIYQGAWSFLIVAIASGFMIHLLKFVFGRKRPYVEPGFCDPFYFDFFNSAYHFHGFPSGHAQVSFTVATFLTFYARKSYHGLLYAAGFIFAMTRVGTRDHFLSDVLLGGFLGFAITYLVMRWLQSKKLVNT